MQYLSTRGLSPERTFTEILIDGLAPDGGLYVPAQWPAVTTEQLSTWRTLSYSDLAKNVIGLFATDIPPRTLAALVSDTYTRDVFGSDAITPLVTFEPGLHVLDLSRGPTLAFKDIALQLLARLFEEVLTRTDRRMVILGATSGDTGSSAEHALSGRRRVSVVMLSPHGKMSPFQTAQMFSIADSNIVNLSIRGVFDDCQDLVKSIMGDADFKEKHQLGAVNSINWARVAAQVVYYFRGYFLATDRNDALVDFSVPTGNFGNILAGWVARRMGLPIRRLILATNENNILDEFFRSGRYRVRSTKDVYQTSSPSMDISKASNFERFIFDLVGRDSAIIRSLWERLSTTGVFDIEDVVPRSGLAAAGIVSGTSTHADRVDTIRLVHQKYGQVVDPHTADGIHVGLSHRSPGIPLICLATAHPAKFESTLVEAIGKPVQRPPGFDGIEGKPQRFRVLDRDAGAVRRVIEELQDAR